MRPSFSHGWNTEVPIVPECRCLGVSVRRYSGTPTRRHVTCVRVPSVFHSWLRFAAFLVHPFPGTEPAKTKCLTVIHLITPTRGTGSIIPVPVSGEVRRL